MGKELRTLSKNAVKHQKNPGLCIQRPGFNNDYLISFR
ncbi:hypothetical protein ASZ90_007334 [hydrocarbon metagenome]|uniref:Uncharacterized protein n=1 Tax=hydrocarbon metagenome TaxID=938273 RepID=A0A0W8FPU3_9ZZZZ